MIAQRWHGPIKAGDKDRYLALMRDVGLADYKRTEGIWAAGACTARKETISIPISCSSWSRRSHISR